MHMISSKRNGSVLLISIVFLMLILSINSIMFIVSLNNKLYCTKEMKYKDIFNMSHDESEYLLSYMDELNKMFGETNLDEDISISIGKSTLYYVYEEDSMYLYVGYKNGDYLRTRKIDYKRRDNKYILSPTITYKIRRNYG